MQVCSRSPAHGLENLFFKGRNCLPILLGVQRPGADVRKAEFLENTPEAHLGQINAKAFAKNALEIHAAPARNSILLRIGTGLHEAPQFFHLLL